MSAGKQSTQVTTAFLISGVVIIGLFTYAMSLRTENAELTGRLSVYEERGDGAGAAGSEAGLSGAEGDAGLVSGDGDDAVELPEPVGPDSTVTAGPLVLGPSERATLASQLGFIPPSGDRRVWLTVTFGDMASARFAGALGEVFTDAGFEVQPTTVARFPIRPGLYFMSADEEPAENVNAILTALETTGYTVTSGRGYRSFYAEKKQEDPTWNGFEMADDQPFVIAVGRSGD